MSIREAIAQVASGARIVKDPKSHQLREVALDRRTVELLREHLADQRRFAAVCSYQLAQT
jgi:predicted secreted Zn-dependent protease